MSAPRPARAASLLGPLLLARALLGTCAPGTYGGTLTNTDLMDVDLMFIGAHPDDGGGIMATFARYLLDGGLKGTVVTLTGGEGGGNVTGRQTGRSLGLNVVLYDGDQKDARVGANISESGLAWASFPWGGKQALPYLWPRVVLGE